MASNFLEWDLQLFDTLTAKPIVDSVGLVTVLQQAVPLAQTVYADAQGTALALPLTMSNGVIRFFTLTSTTNVDLSIMTSTGRAYFVSNVAKSQHRIDVDQTEYKYTLVGAWAVLSAMGDGVVSAIAAPVSGGLPLGLRIKDVYIQKTQAGAGIGATLTMNFGVSGTSAGFINAVTQSATGYFLNQGVFAADATAGTIVAAVQTRGGLISTFHTGASGIASLLTGAEPGFFDANPYMISLVTTTNNLVFSINGTSALTTVAGARGYIFYEYDIIPTAGN